MLFFTENYQLLVEQTNLNYQQHLKRQGGQDSRIPNVTLLDMMNFIGLALQMGHNLKNTLHDY
jgi:hypothetical protein